MSNYLPIYIHESITWNDWNSNDFEYQGGFSSGPQKVPYWYIICKPAEWCCYYVSGFHES